MDVIINFGVSIIASIAATLILLITATLRSKNTRRAMTSIAATFLKVEIKYVFKNTKEAEAEIVSALHDAKHVRIFTSRGNEFQREMYQPILQRSSRKQTLVQILLPDTSRQLPGVNWIDQREREIATFDKAFGQGTLHRQIENNLNFLQAHIIADAFEVRQYNYPHIARVILTDDILFLQPYKDNRHGRYSPVIEYGHGDTYEMFSRLFNMLWESCA